MRDEAGDSNRAVPDGFNSWSGYWTVQGMPWRTEPEIGVERQAYLTERRAVRPDVERGIYPFRDEQGGIRLNRADVEWLLATHEHGGRRGPVDWRLLRDTTAFERHRYSGLDLRGALLSGLDLRYLPLSLMKGGLATEEWVSASPDQRLAAGVHLEAANLLDARLEGASLRGAHLEAANLTQVRLERASLTEAHMEGARLLRAHFEGTFVIRTHFEGTTLSKERLALIRQSVGDFPPVLPPADVQEAYFDTSSSLQYPTLCTAGARTSVQLADVRWNNTNLGMVDWASVGMLGDERVAHEAVTAGKVRKDNTTRLREFRRAVRAYTQLAAQLRAQGLWQDADRFSYRAEVLQREVLRRQGQWARCVGSMLLDLTSGYGYRPLRSLITYAVVVGMFAAAYYLLGPTVHPSLSLHDAVVLSITSFHGRGFSPSESVTLHDPVTTLAAVEAIFGLLIEITFIATFTQRFFAR